MSRRLALGSALSASALAAIPARPSAAAVAAVRGGVLNIGVSAEMNYNMLCFAMTGDPMDYIYSWPIYESLFRPNASGTVDPWLLDSVATDPDGLCYVFHLRPGVVFSDGTRLDASVVKWNLDRYLAVGSKRTELFSSVKSVDMVDEMTLKIALREWSAVIPTALSRECGYMFSRTQYEAHGEAYCRSHPVGTGPFMLENWERNVGKRFVRNPLYWNGAVQLDRVVYTIYNDALVGQAAMLSGEIDVFAGMALTGIRGLARHGFRVAAAALEDHSSLLVFNSLNVRGNDPTGSLPVRQAICHAIDTGALVDASYLGYATVSSQFGIGTHYRSDAITGYDYDPAKARALLAQAGYPNGFKTQIRAAAAGSNKTVLTIMQSGLAAVGIEASLQLLTGASASQALTGWGSGMWYQTSGVYVDVAMQMAAIFPQGLTGGALGVSTMLRPADVSMVLRRAVASRSDADSIGAVREANRLLIDKYALYMPVAEYSTAFVLNARVKNSGIGEIFYAVATLAGAYVET
ncbi:ABC transporter substrate-binding protein [Lichenicola cladoniae]|uniref:ABC transporter substrate-binding protein n=1 Tax=Lichenicola cladoniae TaxID=1484109 RepID=UPI001954BFD7|nr:ABC transporter substrate-binding protein [Lichenicola cladoniae]